MTDKLGDIEKKIGWDVGLAIQDARWLIAEIKRLRDLEDRRKSCCPCCPVILTQRA